MWKLLHMVLHQYEALVCVIGSAFCACLKSQYQKRKSELQANMYVRVYGTVRREMGGAAGGAAGALFIQAYSVKPVTDFNEVVGRGGLTQ
jgi:hypothetical protein